MASSLRLPTSKDIGIKREIKHLKINSEYVPTMGFPMMPLSGSGCPVAPFKMVMKIVKYLPTLPSLPPSPSEQHAPIPIFKKRKTVGLD